jgi:2Fe-2S ferredoxin
VPKAIFISPSGERHEVDVAVGTSLMRAAIDHRIQGIDGDCGGSMSCATCHVFVAPPFDERLLAPVPQEEMMLDCTASARQPNSRLSCQIIMTEELNGVIVQIADPQR